MQKTTVMIVDDHALIRDAWAMMLSADVRFNITDKIGDPTEVEPILHKSHPDIVLLDINMAPIDGFEILKLISKISPKSKVITVTMHNQTALVRKMMNGGAKGYITKNSSAQEFLQGVEIVMEGGQYLCKEVRNALATQMLVGERSKIDLLTRREIEIMKLLREGLSSKEIAAKLSLTPKTVEVHRYNILKKLDVKNTIAAIELANACRL